MLRGLTRGPHLSAVRARLSWPDGVFRRADFRRLWLAQSISLVGSQVSLLALPLVAVLVIRATPAEMGVLGAVQFTPILVVGQIAGAWVDRVPRRPLLVGSDLGRALALGLIPVAAALGVLRIEHLYVIALVTGSLNVIFDTAHLSFLPSLVEREALVEANARLEISRSLAQVAGPTVGGTLVQLLTAPLAIFVDAVSFLTSALFIARIRTPEKIVPAGPRPNVLRQIAEGWRFVFGQPILRSLAVASTLGNGFYQLGSAIYVLYSTRELGISPALLGLIYGAGGVGALLGAFSASRLGHFGVGKAAIVATLAVGVGYLFVPLAGGTVALSTAMLAIGQLINSFGIPIMVVNQISLRQAITPVELQGRVNATFRGLAWCAVPLGALLGGFLGDAVGLRPALAVAAVGLFMPFLWLLFSPVRSYSLELVHS